MTDDRIERLEAKRQELKAKIAAERSRAHPDDLALQRMKLMKCRLKDEIARLRRESAPQASSAA